MSIFIAIIMFALIIGSKIWCRKNLKNRFNEKKMIVFYPLSTSKIQSASYVVFSQSPLVIVPYLFTRPSNYWLLCYALIFCCMNWPTNIFFNQCLQATHTLSHLKYFGTLQMFSKAKNSLAPFYCFQTW
jgi:hypothetical protein